jgi:hypothetical protein
MTTNTTNIINLPIVKELLSSEKPTITYKLRVNLLDESEEEPHIQELKEQIKHSPNAVGLLSHRQSDGTIATNPYTKWQGPHWTLVFLAEMEYPPGDLSLIPLRDQFYDWLFDERHLKYPRSMTIPGQENRIRRCASQEAYAIWYSLKLGLTDERTDKLVQRLKNLRWPDGGWNCDKRPEARISSFHETILPIRALSLYGRLKNDSESLEVARQAAEIFLTRRLYKRRSNGQVIHNNFTLLQYPHFPIYNILLGLMVMVEAGLINDERCNDALDLLESKCLANGGYPLEKKNYKTTDEITTRGTFADWGPAGKRRSNPYVTVDSLYILKEARRLSHLEHR